MQRVACIVDEVNAVRGQKYVGWRAIFSGFLHSISQHFQKPLGFLPRRR
jgi:hypothetical protein